MNICIIGTGYVGLVGAACLAEMGNQVRCVDINPEVIKTLRQGKVHIYEPGLEDLVRRNCAQGRLTFTTDTAEGIADALFVFITVGTPPKPDGSCDLCFVHEAASEIGRTMRDYKIVVNKSTVPVGTADEVRAIVQKELEARGLDVEFDVVSNPEFLKEGDAVNDFMKPDRVILGTDSPRAAGFLKELYAPFARSREKVVVMGIRSAEMTKYAANCILATKISFINEIGNLCEKVGADVREVRLGIGSDHRIGYHFIYPGVGFGGSCFPKDVRALIHTAQKYGYSPDLMASVGKVNEVQKILLARKIVSYFKRKGGVEGKTLALWGLAFKANTDDIREAPSIEIINFLTSLGMRVRAFDPVAGRNAAEELSGNSLVEVVAGQYEALEGAGALAVVTEWNQFRNPDFQKIKAKLEAPVIFDGRNLYSPKALAEAGFSYFCIGRPDPEA